jgi:hypothetical protein
VQDDQPRALLERVNAAQASPMDGAPLSSAGAAQPTVEDTPRTNLQQESTTKSPLTSDAAVADQPKPNVMPARSFNAKNPPRSPKRHPGKVANQPSALPKRPLTNRLPDFGGRR